MKKVLLIVGLLIISGLAANVCAKTCSGEDFTNANCDAGYVCVKGICKVIPGLPQTSTQPRSNQEILEKTLY